VTARPTRRLPPDVPPTAPDAMCAPAAHTEHECFCLDLLLLMPSRQSCLCGDFICRANWFCKAEHCGMPAVAVIILSVGQSPCIAAKTSSKCT
jgi:hypothetical protein